MDIGMSELLVIGIVALIVIGPRDLPEMFRQLGRMTAKMRGMAREFSRAMEQAANETGVKDVAKDLKAITSPTSLGLNTVKGAMDKFEKWDPIKNAAKPTTAAKPLTPPPMPAPMPAPVSATPVLATATVTTEPAILPPEAAPALPPEAATAVPAEVVPTPALGPATAALYEKTAARVAVVAETAAKQKVADKPDVEAATPKPARRKKSDAAPEAGDAKPAAKAPRKKKAAEE